MLKTIRRSGTTARKVTVYIEIQTITFPSKHGLELQANGTFLSVVYTHKQNISYSSGRKAELSPDGGVFVRINETLTQNVTLYMEKSTHKHQEKVGKLVVRKRVKPGNFEECFQGIGHVELHLHEYANRLGETQLYSLPIQNCACEGGEIQCMISLACVGDGVSQHLSVDTSRSFSNASGSPIPSSSSLNHSFASIDSPDIGLDEQQNVHKSSVKDKEMQFSGKHERQAVMSELAPPTTTSSSKSAKSPASYSKKNEFSDPFAYADSHGIMNSLTSQQREYKSSSVDEKEGSDKEDKIELPGGNKNLQLGVDLEAQSESKSEKRSKEIEKQIHNLQLQQRSLLQKQHDEEKELKEQKLQRVKAEKKFRRKKKDTETDSSKTTPPPLPPRNPDMQKSPIRSPPPSKIPFSTASSFVSPAISVSEISTKELPVSSSATIQRKSVDDALLKLTYTDNASRQFTEKEAVSNGLQEFIDSPSFTIFNKAIANDEPKSIPKSIDSTKDGILSTVESSVPASYSPVSTSTTSKAPETSDVKSLTPEYESKAQQAAYMALQAQIESGVVHSDEAEKKSVYFAYYNYYSQYYLQLQLKEGEEERQKQEREMIAAEQMQAEIEQQRLKEQELRDTQQAERIQLLEKEVGRLTLDMTTALQEKESLKKEHDKVVSTLQCELDEMKKQCDNSNDRDTKIKDMDVLRCKLEDADRLVATTTEAKHKETIDLQNQLEKAHNEVETLKNELIVVQQATKGLERTLDFYKTNTEQWKQKCTSLETQLSSSSDEGSVPARQGELDELQGTVEKQSKELTKLKGKIKKYAEKMAGMEVLVAEAAVIVKEHHFASKERTSNKDSIDI